VVTTAAPLALDGTLVVDFTRYVSGSYATMLLSSLGANVIKVEPPGGGDPYRGQGTSSIAGESTLFVGLNAGKRSLAVDMKSAQGREVIERLLAKADVFAENARPGSLNSLGLDYDSLAARHPGLVYLSVSAYGNDGPRASKGGFDLTLQAASGLMSVTGIEGAEPMKVGAPVLDIGSAVCAVLATLAALISRQRTALGCHVTSSLFEFGLATLTSMATGIDNTGDVPRPLGSHSPSFAPYGAFRTASGYVVLAGAGNETLWQKLCQSIGRPDLVTDPRYLTNADRLRHRDELTHDLETALASATAVQWVATFETQGVPAELVADVGQVLKSEDAAVLGMLQRMTTDDGSYVCVAPPFSLGQRPVYPRAAPRLGEHTSELLLGLGYDLAEITELSNAGIVEVAT